MFNLFKKKSEVEKLQDKYKKLLAEAHSLSQRDRKAGDMKMAEAEEVAQKIERIKDKK
ncbi:Lacal_2735 family protein [Catalinimonas alkaloidigena]|uniref:Lacal_2735 family protein n=1 Tax=Catalinimonas alkaloidigena TaxID=1075417 RepID=UPI00240526E2|nr:Lacal_2735 family protein [Catalinimonas alkaloidigena]